MKKTFLTLVMVFALMLSIGFASCNGCGKGVEPTLVIEDTTAVTQKVGDLKVSPIIGMDRQYMFNNYGGDYRWYECCVLLKDYLDEECDGTVAGVSNIFQVINSSEDEKSFDVHVILAAHTPDTVAYEVKEAFWVEDMPMENEAIVVSYEDAFEKLMATNCPKPHSKHAVLRKQVGPVEANPQWIFGNMYEVVFVDAVTGEVSTDNPSFPEAQGFKMPLGEWP